LASIEVMRSKADVLTFEGNQDMNFPNLFSPIQINNMLLKNRIVMTAMHLRYTPEGEVTEKLVNFYVRRAQGGVGLIVVGGCRIDELGGMSTMIGIDEDRYIPGLAHLSEAVHQGGSKIAAQLYQAGRYTHSDLLGGKTPISASAIRSRLTRETPRALELEEIPETIGHFAAAAVRAKKAGFDAVEVLGSAGYLISQFFSAITNKREDQYGGSLENRMRFGLEVVEKIRDAVGADYPIIMRLAGNEFMEGGNTNKESSIFAAELEKVGVDLFNITGGWHETRIPQLTMSVPRKCFVYLAHGIKSAVSKPVLSSNRINDPSLGEEIIRQGQADLVTMARALLADPDLPKKAEEGRSESIYHCVACNQGCFDSLIKPATCMVNPVAGKEGEMALNPAVRPKKVLVVGGGCAGMKAAITAAERGHRVTLVEKRDGLGGQLLLNRNIPGREELVTAATDLIHNLKTLTIDVELGVEVTRENLTRWTPEVIVLATGARPLRPNIPGIESDNVVHAWDVLAGKAEVGKRVVIVGGNAVGLETAIYLANQGTLPPEVLHFLVTNRAETWDTLEMLVDRGFRDVTVAEMVDKAGQDIGPSTRWTMMKEIRRLGVKLMTSTKVVTIESDGLRLAHGGEIKKLQADSIVIATGAEALNQLAEDLHDLVPEIYTIGDAKEPRNALTAIREGFLAGLEI
jgi:2,4-dienoyl-CoA reductase (NADPH2)